MAEPYTVLVVDDVDVVRHTANRILTKEGYLVLEAADADEALAVLSARRAKVDLVLLDVVLPDSDGVALYADICARWPRIPVVFMSAYAAEILVARGQEDLTVPFLAKPFTREQLTTKVGAAIERRRSPREPRTSGPQPMRT
jgi:two-component system cell cycle sensor histidine kinase/response regulator CckA